MIAPIEQRDRGIATPVELMYLLVFAIVATLFVGYLGRLHAAGVQVANAGQLAARAASLEPDPDAGEQAMRAVLGLDELSTRCAGGPEATLTWSASSFGTWRGGSVTVVVRCTVHNRSLTGVWSPGSRTVVMSDTQPVDRYQR